MARTGLRMMPTFPSSPPKIPYGGFSPVRLQGWLSESAFPRVAPTCRALSVCIPPSFCRFQLVVLRAVSERLCVQNRHASGCAALPQGSSLRPGLCCPDPSSLNRPHPPHSWAQRAFAALQLIRPAFAVRFRLGDPRLVPCFHCSFFLSMSSSTTPGSLTAAYTQFLRRQRWPSPLQHSLGTPILPTNPFRVGVHFGASLRFACATTC